MSHMCMETFRPSSHRSLGQPERTPTWPESSFFVAGGFKADIERLGFPLEASQPNMTTQTSAMLQRSFSHDSSSSNYQSACDHIAPQRVESARPTCSLENMEQRLSLDTLSTDLVGTIPSEPVEYSMQMDRHSPCLDPFISPHAVTYGYTNAWQGYKSSAETIECSWIDMQFEWNVVSNNSLDAYVCNNTTHRIEVERTATHPSIVRPSQMRSVPKRTKGNSRAVISPAAKRLTCTLVTHAGTETIICNKNFLRPEHLKRHMLTVHGERKEWICKLPGCRKCFSRADNLRDHYWTHVDKGGLHS